MRPATDYVMLRDYKAPGSAYAYALRAGDEISELGRTNAGLVVGLDVRPLRPDVMPRPADDADRSTWQDYAVVQGVPYTEAANLDRAELMSRIETQDPPADPDNAADMPAEGDRKARWQDYAVLRIIASTGGRVDEVTARQRIDTATKAELVDAFGPDGDDGPDEWYAVPGEVEQVGPHGDIIVETRPEG